MEFGETVRRRRMVRSFDPDVTVDPGVVQQLLDGALRAPSAGFTQGVSFLVADEEPGRQRFWTATTEPGATNRWLDGMRTAPVLVLVWTDREAYLDRYAEPDKGWSDRDLGRWSAPYWFVDAGMASMSILLGAVDQGLGACFFGVPVDAQQAVREVFGVPADQLSVGAIALGAPAQAAPSGSITRRRRVPVDARIRRGHW